jgi:hypothetical protein
MMGTPRDLARERRISITAAAPSDTWCYRVTVKVLQSVTVCYGVSVRVLQRCCVSNLRAVAGSGGPAHLLEDGLELRQTLHGGLAGPLRGSQEAYRRITRGLHKGYTRVTQGLHKGYTRVQRELQVGYRNITGGIYDNYKRVTRGLEKVCTSSADTTTASFLPSLSLMKVLTGTISDLK